MRSASASAATFGSPPYQSFALPWYCVELILDKIRHLTLETEAGSAQERLHRLRLTLISTVPSLPLPLMIRVLDEIQNIVVNVRETRERKELVDAVFAEILEGVGDREKEASIKWWYTNRPSFAQATLSGGRKLVMKVGVAEHDQPRTMITPHL